MNQPGQLQPAHQKYLSDRGVNPAIINDTYSSASTDPGSDLCILYCDPEGKPYETIQGDVYLVRRQFGRQPKFKAPAGNGSRPYFSRLMPQGYLDDLRIPVVFVEGPVKVDALYQAIPTGFCFIGITGTWNIRDRRDENGKWSEENETRSESKDPNHNENCTQSSNEEGRSH